MLLKSQRSKIFLKVALRASSSSESALAEVLLLWKARCRPHDWNKVPVTASLSAGKVRMKFAHCVNLFFLLLLKPRRTVGVDPANSGLASKPEFAGSTPTVRRGF